MKLQKTTKPCVLLYNPPGAINKRIWEGEPLPLNLLCICSLIDQEQYEFSISQDFPEQAFLEFAPLLDRAVCLGISCMTGLQITNGLSLARKIKSLKGELPVIWGGYHPSALPEQTALDPLVDIVVRGYGEETFAELVDALSKGRKYEDIKGITFSKKDEILSTADRPACSLNDLPPLPYHLYDIEAYFKRISKRYMCYSSSRGCPHHCGFCADYVIYQGKWNALAAKRVIADLEYLKERYNFEYLQFYDSNLFIDEARIKEICIGIIEKELNFQALLSNGDALIISRYSDETLDLMKQAGISNVVMGVESGYAKALECISKPANVEQVFESARRLHSKGISIVFSFMFGFPYDLPKSKLLFEHRNEILATMKMMTRLSEDFIPGDEYSFFIYRPYPGVKLFERYIKLGYNPPSEFKDWATRAGDLFGFSRTPWLSEQVLQLYVTSFKIIWFLTRQVKNKLFLGAKSELLKNISDSIERFAIKTLREYIARDKIKIPFLLICLQHYCNLRGLSVKELYLKIRIYLKKKLPVEVS